MTIENENQFKSTRDGFGAGLVEATKLDPKVVGVCADLSDSVRMLEFARKYPDRYFEVGVAEQNLIGVAVGLAQSGLVPFAASYACFSLANSWGVIRTSVCYSQANVKIVGGHTGLATGADGATHQALEDMAIMRVLPHMTVIVPADGHQTYQATLEMAKHQGPVYLRTYKLDVPNITALHQPFVIGQADVLTEGSDVSLVACGYMVHQSLAVAEKLAAQGISTRVINMSTIKPLDVKTLEQAFKKTRLVMTLEDHQVSGGLGSAVAEVALEAGWQTRFKRIGVQDSFGESGKAEELYRKYRLDAEFITDTVLALL